ncbi:glycerophosphodiester phosphodiesterase [Sphaerisporangium album]|uniref:Glycerophosphodiester phosphodiesterase n=1 Tax=Sphaerisporangium album TaxID=509200 RepID=A0A367F188_9ACTN|nr:glycerophosphodiester phosphodiesterase family protein [Sphaerisporangium album]RCG24021.1 glycerophosphodiester phosphodiesterase [Sphaerisporangium album]
MFRRLGLIVTTTLTALATTTIITTTPASPAAAHTGGPTTTPAAVADVAHRGASKEAPENTIAAFRLAARRHADMFELDVQETRDHRLVVMHDTTLARTTDAERVLPGRAPWRVRDLTLAQVKRLDAGSWFSQKYRGERVPTLGETLDALGGSGIGMLLEVKAPHLYPGIEARVARELRRHPAWLRPGRLVVQSFDWNSMRRFHRVMPEVPVGLLGTPAPARLPELAKFARQINPPYHHLTARYVRDVHRLGMQVYTWTVDSRTAARRLISYRVDGILTNRPGRLRKLIRE